MQKKTIGQFLVFMLVSLSLLLSPTYLRAAEDIQPTLPDENITADIQDASTKGVSTPEAAVTSKENSASNKKTLLAANTNSAAATTSTTASATSGTSDSESMVFQGSTPSANVSEFGGGAAVSLPIIIPPGRNGLVPNLNISHSRGTNGWLGVGWSLDIGSIQRSSKFGVKYSNNDFVAFKDGAPADLVPRPDWGTNYYGSKVESTFTKFYYDTTNKKWIVTFKNGMKFYYGSTAASRLTGTSETDIFKWCLDRVEDSNGNYLRVEYFKDGTNREIYLSKIIYTNHINDGLSPDTIPHGEIKFYREERPDIYNYAIGNALVYVRYRLKTINIRTNANQEVRAYKLNYDPSPVTFSSTLSSIQQYGTDTVVDDNSGIITDGSALPPITLSMNLNDHVTLTAAGETIFSQAEGAIKVGAFWADLNGDKKVDYMWVESGSNKCHTFLNNGNGSFTESFTTPANPDNPGNPAVDYNGWKFEPGDYNGDGLMDYLWFKTSPDSPSTSRIVHVFLSNGDGTFAERKEFILNIPNPNNATYYLHTGDFNGDGKTDLMWMDNTTNIRHIYSAVETGNNIFAFETTATLITTNQKNYNTFLDVNGYVVQVFSYLKGDFNGDGKTDYMWIDKFNNTSNVFLSTGNGDFEKVDNSVPGFGYGADGQALVSGDFNGDGKTDYLWAYIRNTMDSTCTFFNNGDGTFSAPVCSNPGTGALNDDYYKMMSSFETMSVGDFNGDGKTDLIFIRKNIALLQYGYRVHAGVGDGTFKYDGGDRLYRQGTSEPLGGIFTDIKLYIGDVTGDGADDVIINLHDVHTNPLVPPDDAISIYVKTAPSEYPLFALKSVANGLGGSTSFHYRYSNDYSNTFLPFVFPVVEKITTNDGFNDANSTSTVTYNYAKGEYVVAARDFRGFGVVSSNNPDNVTTTTWYHQTEYLKGRPDITTQKDSTDFTFSMTKTDWPTPVDLGNGAKFVKTTKSRTETYDQGTDYVFAQNEFTYDDTNGNVLTTKASGTGAEDVTTATEYANLGSAGSWLWSPTKVTVTGSVSGKVREATFTYYPDCKGNIKDKENWLNGGTNPKVTYTYDQYGNSITIKDAIGQSTNQVTSIDYDLTTNTYPIKVTAPQTGSITHIVENSEINYGLGKATKTKDENGNSTRSVYDFFGRLKEVNTEDGGKMSYDYHRDVFPSYSVATVRENLSGAVISSYAYYDGFGRPIQNLGFGENNKTIVTRAVYDQMGRVAENHGPYYSVGVGPALTPYDVSQPATAVFSCPYGGSYSDQSVCNTNCTQQGSCSQHSHNGTYSCAQYAGTDATRCNTGCDQDGYSGNVCCPADLTIADKGNNCPTYTTLIPQGYYEKSSYMTSVDGSYICWGDWYQVYSFNERQHWTCPLTGVEYNAASSCSSACYTMSACSGPVYSCPSGWTQSGAMCSRPNATGYPWVKTIYDNRGRPSRIESPSGQQDHVLNYGGVLSAHIAYSGLSTTTTDPDGRVKSQLKDYLGRVVQITEQVENNVQQNTTYTYNAAGDLLTVTDPDANSIIIGYDTLGRKNSVNDPDRGIWSYTYNANNNMITRTDARGITITFSYDALNRVTSRTYSTGKTPVAYTYDNLTISNGRGRLSSISNGFVTKTVNAYDIMGRMVSASKVIAGNAAVYTTQSGYDLSGKLKTITYPDNTTIGYSYYPGTSLIKTVFDAGTGKEYARYSFYEPSGKIGQINHGNGAMTRYSYDVFSGRLTGLVSADPSNTPANDYQTKSYLYYPSGDIQAITDYKKNVTFTYTYDALHRLKTETNNGGLPPMTMTYDAIGNITSKMVGSNTMTYNYDTVKKHAVKQITFNGTAYTFQYDQNGNMTTGYDFTDSTSIGTRTMTYDADNSLSNIVYVKGGVTATAAMSYDESGERVKKVGAVTTYYIGEHYEVKDGVPAKFITAGNQKLVVIQGSNIYYFHKDHLGSAAAMSNAAGLVVETTDYMPFGAVRSFTGTSVTNHRYTGQELDPESGLYYYKSRYYDNVLARFISPDSIYPDLYDPQALNGYSYCGNNPLIYVDPSGHFFDAATLAAIVIGAAAGAISAGIASDGNLKAMLVGGIIGGISGAVFKGVSVVAGELISKALTLSVGYCSTTLTSISTFAGNVIGGAASGATAGGLNAAVYGGNIGEAVLKGAAYGAVTAAIFSGLELGWNYMRDVTDASASKSEYTPNVKDGEGNRMTFGERAGKTNSLFNRIFPTVREGTNPFMLDPDNPIARFCTYGSKVHDFLQEPWYVNGGNVPRGVFIDTILRDAAWNYPTMLPAAAYTLFAKYGQYMQGAVYELTSDKRDR